MKTEFGFRLQAQTAEEVNQVQNATGVRQRIVEFARHDPLTERTLTMARLRGLSGEDTYVYLAYHALIAKQECERLLRDTLLNRPVPPPFTIPEGP